MFYWQTERWGADGYKNSIRLKRVEKRAKVFTQAASHPRPHMLIPHLTKVHKYSLALCKLHTGHVLITLQSFQGKCTKGFNAMGQSTMDQRKQKPPTTWMKITSSSFLSAIQKLAVMNPPSRGLSHSVTRGGGHWPHVHDAGTLRQTVGGQMG